MQPVCPVCEGTDFVLSEVFICEAERDVEEWGEDGRPAKLGERGEMMGPEPAGDYPFGDGDPNTVRSILGTGDILCLGCGMDYDRAPRKGDPKPEVY